MEEILSTIFFLLSKQMRYGINQILYKNMQNSIGWFGSFVYNFQKAFHQVMDHILTISNSFHKEISFKLKVFDSKFKDICRIYIDEYGENIFEQININPYAKLGYKITFIQKVKPIAYELLLLLPVLQTLINTNNCNILIPDRISNSNIIFSTLSSSGHSILKKCKKITVDILLVDEAAQVDKNYYIIL